MYVFVDMEWISNQHGNHTKRGVRKNGHLAAFSILLEAKDTPIYGIDHSRRSVCLFMLLV